MGLFANICIQYKYSYLAEKCELPFGTALLGCVSNLVVCIILCNCCTICKKEDRIVKEDTVFFGKADSWLSRAQLHETLS